jgi:hypothetical protein
MKILKIRSSHKPYVNTKGGNYKLFSIVAENEGVVVNMN